MMEPRTFELTVDSDGNASAGQGVLAAYVPASDHSPPVSLLACDPRHEPGKSINELAPAVMAYMRARIDEDSPHWRWTIIDSIGRFNQAVPKWRTGAHPDVAFERFPRGLTIDAFFSATGAGGEAAMEMLSAMVETPRTSDQTPSEREFLEAVEVHGNLPAPGSIFQKVDAAVADGDARLIASAIQPDPALSMALISSANAARFAAAGKTASVPQAVIRLGTGFVRRVVFVAEMMERYQQGACPTFDYRQFWMNSIASGASMKALMPSYDIPEKFADDAFTIGLVAGIGWLAIAETFPGLMTAYVARCRGADPITKSRAQREIFPCAIRSVSERYLERYSFPRTVLQAIAGNTGGDRRWYDCLAQAMRVAQPLAPFDCIAVPTTIPVPDACREEWDRWKSALCVLR
ncbi:MAG: HDOD domain-containing protein [Sulfuritalea sp.]|nr:HDOD domain-containing protein [Sulfuritalea sp.]